MSGTVKFTIDGVEVQATPGQTIMEAADAAKIYIPRLCAFKGLSPTGSCRICTVTLNGRPQAACTQPVAEGAVVENDTEALRKHRTMLVDMLFSEGNHFCPGCEKSGNCELQATAYRFGMAATTLPYYWRSLEIDASHPDVYVDRNRCILCGRCVSASRDVDKKTAFDFVGRGTHRCIQPSAAAGLCGTTAKLADKAMTVCPVGAIVEKRVGFAVPVGKRKYDLTCIGSEIEGKK
jgi:[NiFe] hydrogenase diaphorase moiety small subunit